MPVDDYVNDFDKVADDWERLAGLAVGKTIARIHEEVNVELAQEKHGRKRADGHIASAPGEPPANDTGALSASVTHRMTDKLEGEVVVGSESGVYLELGGRFLAPRPFLAPAVEKVWPEFIKAMEQITK